MTDGSCGVTHTTHCVYGWVYNGVCSGGNNANALSKSTIDQVDNVIQFDYPGPVMCADSGTTVPWQFVVNTWCNKLKPHPSKNQVGLDEFLS